MKPLHFTIASFILLACSCGSVPKEESKQLTKVSIPFYFGFNNDNYPSDSTIVKISDSNDSVVFVNIGYKLFWGLQAKGQLKISGKYKVHVVFYPDSLDKKEFEEFFNIDGDEKRIDLSVNLMNGFGGKSNEVYVNKYFDNKYNVQLKRIWDPQEEFTSKKELLPEYEWSNPSDSTIFGIYRHLSSSSMTSWVQNWNIGFMQFQKYNDTEWVSMECNAPRIEAEIKKGQTGKTLKDMILACPGKEFERKGKYRILIEYGINDAIYRTTKASGKLESSFYFEPHIYQVADEFTIQ